MSGEQYFWRSGAGATPVQLPRNWAVETHRIKRHRPLWSKIARAFHARVMKNDAARAYFAAEQQSKIALRGHQQVATLLAAGVPVQIATLRGIQDTQQTINENPILLLEVEVTGDHAEIVALVPRIAVPRPGNASRSWNTPRASHCCMRD
ncbi:hypothetical protein JOF28_001387 [Leucobacter exalbidus]|uniref:Uncharacterized protein n=1 Tax=Leucobacter exalbidus TaxID=662960 RepID=A0A940PN65_9MICO|nr:hypothetical protein [Leucobacter exalbidus]MBP1326155.1 hypothetical protein [Leucobacter exalbidus]